MGLGGGQGCRCNKLGFKIQLLFQWESSLPPHKVTCRWWWLFFSGILQEEAASLVKLGDVFLVKKQS